MVDPAIHIKSLFIEGRHETSAQPGAAAVVAAFYVINHRDTTVVVTYKGGKTPGKFWAKEFAKNLEEVGVHCTILQQTSRLAKCRIIFPWRPRRG